MKSESQILKDARKEGYEIQKIDYARKGGQPVYRVELPEGGFRTLTAHEIADLIYIGFESRSIKPVIFWTVVLFVGIILLATAAHAGDYCDGEKINDYCADLPKDVDTRDECPEVCGITRCDIWYQRGKCGQIRQAEDKA